MHTHNRNGKNTKQESLAVAGSTARCRCRFRYVLKFTAASRGLHCDSTAFVLTLYCMNYFTILASKCTWPGGWSMQ